jgi:hypothetical protein
VRLNRAIRRRGIGGLTDSQRWFLQYGPGLINGAPFPFADEREAAQVWRAHSAALMAASRPGARPAGFWRYELRMFRAAPSFWRGLSILIERGLVEGVEAAHLEHDCRELSADPGTFCQSFDSAEIVAKNPTSHLDHDSRSLMGTVEHFQTAAAFHRFRGRPAIAATWERRAAVAQSVIDADPAMRAEAHIRAMRRTASEARWLQESRRR